MTQSRSASATQTAPQPSPSRSVRLPGEDLSLNEMLRVMDVARELRRNRDLAEEMFRRGDVRTELRAKLMRSAEIAGDRVTAAEIDAAIDHYLANLHTYADPEPSFKRMLAHAWVWRRRVIAGAAAAAIAIGGVWYLFLSPVAPLSSAVRTERAVAAEQAMATRLVEQVRAISQDPAVIARAESLQRQIDATGADAAELTSAIAAKNELAVMVETLSQSYEIHVVSGEGRQSAVERGIDGKASIYYLIVEARDANGRVIPRAIRNSESGRIETVSSWAEEVPAAVYQRVRADKEQDGLINETLFAAKPRGTLEPVMKITGPSGTPLTPGNRITTW